MSRTYCMRHRNFTMARHRECQGTSFGVNSLIFSVQIHVACRALALTCDNLQFGRAETCKCVRARCNRQAPHKPHIDFSDNDDKSRTYSLITHVRRGISGVPWFCTIGCAWCLCGHNFVTVLPLAAHATTFSTYILLPAPLYCQAVSQLKTSLV